MAELVDAKPGLDPDRLFDSLPSELWGALVLQVIGQQLSLAAAAAILGRLNGDAAQRISALDGSITTTVEANGD